MEKYKCDFIDFMVESGVLLFGDFIAKSGRKTPYFVNTGNYKTGAQLYKLGHYYSEAIMNVIGGNSFDVLFGPAYKGIPLAASTAYTLYTEYGIDKKYCFNRKEVKDHGEGGVFVGAKLGDGDRVVIIEDVMTSGLSIRETLPYLKAAADITIPHEFISVDRMEVGLNGKTAIKEIYEEFGIQVHSIVTVVEIIEHMRDKLSPDVIGRMEHYLEQYCEK